MTPRDAAGVKASLLVALAAGVWALFKLEGIAGDVFLVWFLLVIGCCLCWPVFGLFGQEREQWFEQVIGWLFLIPFAGAMLLTAIVAVIEGFVWLVQLI